MRPFYSLWLAFAYLASNLVLNGLNWFWFTKMIGTLRKRFDPPLGTRRAERPKHIDIPENEKVMIEGMYEAYARMYPIKMLEEC